MALVYFEAKLIIWDSISKKNPAANALPGYPKSQRSLYKY